jgi:serine/threonine protein kinase/tetratricopeptide (TPR) repeat protein
MDFSGLADSGARFVDNSPRCGCGSVARIRNGLCLSCLLQSGIGAEEDGPDAFDSVLAQTDVPDRDWQLGNYQILEEIGRGGMGVIYRARHRPSARVVALKRVLSYHSDSTDTLNRFQREARAAATLDHPNILPIYDVGATEDGLPFFTMKFAAGGSLADSRPPSNDIVRWAVRLVAKVARAVHYAHGAGILHRDLKPGNILLDGRGDPLVSDFGLAKWLDTNNDLTRTLTVFGTPGYIAPEQANKPNSQLTPAVDVYSLGAILFELLAGRPPFLGEHAIAVIRQADEAPAPTLRSVLPTVSRDLETICAKCMERDPTMRYESAAALAEDLQRWLERRTILARPVSAPVRLWRWSRRNPGLAVAGMICALLLTAIVMRQIQTARLQTAIRANAAADHSIALLPFLNLGAVESDGSVTDKTARLLEAELAKYGPARVALIDSAHRYWTGAATQDEVREATRDTGTRFALAGTFRRVNEKVRVSIHLLRNNGTEVLRNWLIETNASELEPGLLAARDLAGSIYALIDRPDAVSAVNVDPVMNNDEARRFFDTGRSLVERKTLADTDRAIACFQHAIMAEPRSVLARSVLAMACMTRDSLSSSAPLVDLAQRTSREAESLAPADADANRALSFIDQIDGRYAESLEYAFRAIEYGDRSDRMFGQIAYSWKMLGRPDKALLWYRKAKTNANLADDYDASLGDCFTDLGQNEQAEAAYRSAMEFRPEAPEGWMGVCRLKLLSGNFLEARSFCQSEAAAYSDSPSAQQMRALVAFFSRDYREAEELYAQLLRKDPDGGGKAGFYGAVDYRSALACIEARTGRPIRRELLEKSMASAKAELKQAPRNPQALYQLAAVEALQGKKEAALQTLRVAIACGWIDYKSMRLDPRFDAISATPEFANLVSNLTISVAALAGH